MTGARLIHIACVMVVVLAIVPEARPLAHEARSAEAAEAARVQDVVNELQAALGLSEVVRVAIVDENPRMVSVGRAGRGFVMAFDRDFLADLTTDELRGVVAHELGHVWIFGHHPYLHTEQLANQIALRVVDRAPLEAAYRKVHARGGAVPARHAR